MRPILVEFLGLRIASAPVFAGVAALAAALYFERRRADLDLSEDDFWTLMLFLMVGVFLGSVGLYLLVYGGGWSGNAAFLRRNGTIPGGSFLGTFAGAAAAVAFFCRLRRRAFLPVADVLAVAAPLGLAIMRLGCLLNGCCHGRPTNLPWAVEFDLPCAVRPDLRGLPLHPTQLYEAVGDVAIFALLHFWVRPLTARGRLRGGDALAVSLGLYGLLRCAVDHFRAGDPGIVSPMGLTLAQWAGAAAAAWAASRFLLRRFR